MKHSEIPYQQLLAIPLEADEIQWRVGQSGVTDKGVYCMLLAYMDARAVQRRFDLIFGIENWKVEVTPVMFGSVAAGGTTDEYYVKKMQELCCGFTAHLSCRIDGEWITKTGTANFSNFEGLKGAESDAIKRAAFMWGMGRYLYDTGTTFGETRTERPPREERELWTRAKASSRNRQDVWYWWKPKPLRSEFLPTQEQRDLLFRLEEMKSLWGPSVTIQDKETVSNRYKELSLEG